MGYGNVTVVLEGNCSGDEEKGPCRLRIRMGQRLQGLSIAVRLEHMSGEHWLGRLIAEDLEDRVPEGATDDGVALECLPVQFRVDARGVASHLGIDTRQGEDIPTVWFERVEVS